MKKIHVLLALSSLCLAFPLTANACIVSKTIAGYENGRAQKHLTKSPFDMKFHKNERVYERRYNLGADLVLRLFSRTNQPEAIVYQADVFMGNQKPLPGSEKDIHSLIQTIGCQGISGVPKVSTSQEKGFDMEVSAFPSGLTVIILKKNAKTYSVQVFNRELKREALRN